jgi:hypothetical protein
VKQLPEPVLTILRAVPADAVEEINPHVTGKVPILIDPNPEAIEPLVSAPTVVNEDVTIELPNTVADSTEVPLIL